MAKPARSYLMLSLENNCQHGRYSAGEGAGLASIRDVAERRGGRVDVEENATEFHLTVLVLLF